MTTPIKRGEFEFSLVAKAFAIFIMMVVIADIVTRLLPSSTGILATQYMQSQMYQGVSDPRDCECDSEGYTFDFINESPYTPWVSVQIINDGAHSVYVGINSTTKLLEVKTNEAATVSRVGAVERISYVYCVCSAGETTDVRLAGEY